MKWLFCSLCILSVSAPSMAVEPEIIKIWPGKPPGETKELPPEINITKKEDKPVGDRTIIKLTNVSTPTISIYRPTDVKDTGMAVIICPGGGHRILAFDHQGTEVAEWLAKRGITGILLKYRVPARNEKKRYEAAVQDAQRATSFVRSNAKKWGIQENKIGILGFSAGGETAGLTAILHETRLYDAIDEIDKVSPRPDFAVLVYPGGLLDKGNDKLRDYIQVSDKTPPMFLAHSFDDNVDPRNSILLATALKEKKVSCEMHIYASGGHGWGMRQTGHPCNQWIERCHEWLVRLK